MGRNNIIKEIGRPIFKVIVILQTISLIAFISTPLVWMWVSWFFAWRIGLSGLLFLLILNIFNKIAKSEIDKAIDDVSLNLKNKGTSKFQKRLNELIDTSDKK
jgi:hypothetical protein